jgi:hypothetical protein
MFRAPLCPNRVSSSLRNPSEPAYNFPSSPLEILPPHTNTMSFMFARIFRVPAPRIRLICCTTTIRNFASTSTRLQTSIPTTASCPSPTCECASTPPDLDIDRKTPLLNTMAAYSEQVILCTGKEDWHSNIEQDDGATGAFVKGLKDVIGKGGQAFDVCSFPSTCTTRREVLTVRDYSRSITSS